MTATARLRVGALAGALLCVGALSACGNTLQDRPIAHNILERLIVAPYPVYWLGATFEGHSITEATMDPGGAYRLQYGDCVAGGQSTCIPVLRVVTSPDNSFIPGAQGAAHQASIRGATVELAEGGDTIEVPTAGVVVSVHATTPALARRAAQTIVPINQPGAPQAPLPARLPDTGYDQTPLPAQMPSPLHPPPGPALLH